jgi:hypothetical protein
MAKIYNFKDIKRAKEREDYLQFRHETIQTTLADIEEMLVELSTEIAVKYMQAHLNLSEEELTEWLLERENILETEKPNT